MVGEPTTYPKAWFDAFPDAADATPLLNEARSVKTAQEIERMRLANEIAAAATEHVQGVLRPGMNCAQAAAEWQGFVHGEGTGWNGQVELALPFSLVWSGSSIKTFRPFSVSSLAAQPPLMPEPITIASYIEPPPPAAPSKSLRRGGRLCGGEISEGSRLCPSPL